MKLKVACRTIDSFDFRNIELIKIDVEGCEQDVIDGAMNTIQNWLPNIIIENANTRHLRLKIEATMVLDKPYLISIDGNKTPNEYNRRPSKYIRMKAPKIMNHP